MAAFLDVLAATNATPPVKPDTVALEKAVKNANGALETAREAAGGVPNQNQSAALNRLKATANAAHAALKAAQQA